MTVIRTYVASLLVLCIVAVVGWVVLAQGKSARESENGADTTAAVMVSPQWYTSDDVHLPEVGNNWANNDQHANEDLNLFNVPIVAQGDSPKTSVARLRADVTTASVYSRKYHGRKTASGERLNIHALTAAHKSLAFGTRVRITNRSNGKSVIVRINDRGPFVKNRLIDVSPAAARSIGIRGLAQVSLLVIR